MLRKVCLAIAAALLLVGVTFGVERVRYHARTEVSSSSAPRTAERPGELMREALYEGQRVVFEACSIEADAFGPALTDKLAFEIVVVPSDEIALSVVTDRDRLALARRNERGVCIQIGTAERLGGTGVFAMRLRPLGEMPHVASHMPIVGRIIAVTPVSDADFLPVAALLFGMLFLLLGLVQTPSEEAPPLADKPRAYVAVGFALFALVLAVYAGNVLPRWGVIAVLLNAAIIMVVEVTCLLSVPRTLGTTPSALLALARPKRLWLLPLAFALGGVLHAVGQELARRVPSTGTAPIETLVATTSGFVAVALVSVAAPVIEELFFRGLVYGALARAGNENAAAALSFVLFVLVHVPQAFGAWGALASIALTGAVLVALRRATGSVIVPAVAHLVYNAAITVLSFLRHAG